MVILPEIKPRNNSSHIPDGATVLHPPEFDTSERLAGLMQRIAARDRDAFSALYSATSAKLYGIIVRILRRRDIADEILQDVYLKIWESAGTFEAAKGSPITWMASIARNRAIDEVKRYAIVPIDEAPGALEVASGEPDALSAMASKQELQRLLACMDKLEKERRELVLLAYVHGLSREELAARFGRPVATIKTWLHRSLVYLRDCVGK